MSDGITGRDELIIAKALAYAIVSIERLPEEWQATSDLNDMKLCSIQLAQNLRTP
jgi:hypothetical protein